MSINLKTKALKVMILEVNTSYEYVMYIYIEIRINYKLYYILSVNLFTI